MDACARAHRAIPARLPARLCPSRMMMCFKDLSRSTLLGPLLLKTGASAAIMNKFGAYCCAARCGAVRAAA